MMPSIPTRVWHKLRFRVAGFTVLGVFAVATVLHHLSCEDIDDARAVMRDDGGSLWQLESTTVIPRAIHLGQSPQGVTAVPGSRALVFSGSNLLHMTDRAGASQVLLEEAIPPPFAAQHFHHIGDVSAAVYRGEALVFAAIENANKTRCHILTYDAASLAFRDACPIPQRHASFAAVDPRTMTVYSSEFKGVAQIGRYRYPGCEQLPPLRLRRDGRETSLTQVQGATVYGHLLFLTTNHVKANRGSVFAIDMHTGDIKLAMDLRLPGAEMEGITLFGPPDAARMLITMKLCTTPYAVQLRNGTRI